MQSVHQFMQETEMESNRERLGIEPIHFMPKVEMDQIVFQDNLDFCDRASSIHQLPKFASTRITTQSSAQRNYYQVSRRIYQNIFQNTNKNLIIYPLKNQNGNISSLLTFVIWISYALGASQSKIQINTFNLIDFMGMGMGFCLTFYNVIICKTSIQLDHLLHLLGIVLTIVLAIYQPTPGDSFPFILRIIRSFRLFFIMNSNYHFQDLFHMYFHKICRILKVMMPWVFITLLFSLIMHQSTYYQYYNRCSTVAQNTVMPNMSHNALCGSKTCDNGMICANPMSYDQIPDTLLYNNNSKLAFGYFQYDNLIHSYFTIVSSAFLTNTSKIIDIFSTSSPILLIVIVTLLLVVLSQFFGSPAFLILLQQYYNQMVARMNDLSNDHNSSKVRVSNISGNGDLNSFLAPTFGPNSSKSIQNKFKKSNDQLNQNRNSSEISPNSLGPSRSVKFIDKDSSKSNKQIEHQQAQGCYTKTIQIVTIVFVILVGSAHFGLAITFVFGNLHELENRLVGVCLIVIFIVWSFWILLKISGVTQEEDGKRKNAELDANYTTIFSVDIVIYCIHLADYATRIFIGGYILEEISPLTPLATSLLLVRIIYLPIAFENVMFTSDRWKNLNKSIRIFKDLVNNILSFFAFIVIASLILATFTKEINGLSYFYQTIKYLKIFLNVNWIEHYIYSSGSPNVDAFEGWGVLIKLVIMLIGQLLILKMIMADTIINAYHVLMKDKQLTFCKIDRQTINQEERKQLIRREKTFFLIPYEFLSIRSTVDNLLQTQNYKSGKQKITTIYVFALFIGQCLFTDSKIYTYVIFIGDVILLADAFFTMLAYRFWGEGSLVDKKWYNLVNFIVTIIIMVNQSALLFDAFFIRVFRVFLLLQFQSKLEGAYSKIVSYMEIMKKFLVLLLIIWVLLTLMTGIMLGNTSNSNVLNIIIQASNMAIRLMQQGFDLPSAITFSSESQIQFYTLYNSIIFLFVRIPLECILIGVGISYFRHLDEAKQEEEMVKEAIKVSNQNSGLTVRQNYETQQIKKKILSYQPVYNSINDLQSNFIINIFNQYSNAFTYLKTLIILVDASLLLSLPIITPYVTPQQLLQVKLARFSIYFLEVMLFILDSIVYKAYNDQFYLKLGLYICSFPGSLIMMIPIHKIQASMELIHLFQFLLMLTPLPLVQLYYIAKNTISRVIDYVINRFNYTLWIGLWMLAANAFFSGILILLVNQSFLYLFSLVFIGMCGSTYQVTLEKNQHSSIFALYFIEICIFYTGLILRSILIASFIYEGVQKMHVSQNLKTSQNIEISRTNFNQIFNEQKFIELWNKFDKKAIGMLPFKTVINHLFQFAKCFNLHHLYIEYILKPKHQVFALKLQLFRKLHLPIRSVSTIYRSQKDRSSEYMVTLYDLIARFYCLSLEDHCQKMHQANQINQFTHTYRNWSNKLGFDSQQWSKILTERLNAVNYKRWNEQQLQEKPFVPKQIQTQSWSLTSVLRIFPAIRNRLSSVKQKIKLK